MLLSSNGGAPLLIPSIGRSPESFPFGALRDRYVISGKTGP
jgi:hypothetical protein